MKLDELYCGLFFLFTALVIAWWWRDFTKKKADWTQYENHFSYFFSTLLFGGGGIYCIIDFTVKLIKHMLK